MKEWYVFGDIDKFSFQFKFCDDPDGGKGVSDGMSASWGCFRIYVNSVNLCEAVGVVDNAHGGQKVVVDAVTWYLLPMFCWLADNWDPLFHEGKFPETVDTNGSPNTACNVYGQYESVLCDVESPKGLKKFKKWQKWWKRHAFRESSAGGLFPDIFIRRFDNDIELSWGDSRWPGMPEGYCLAKPGARIMPISEVVPHLHEALTRALELLQAKCPASEEIAEFAQIVARIPRTSLEERLRWVAEIPLVEQLIEKFERVYKALQDNIVSPFVVEELSPIKLMFGAVSPRIERKDVENILRWLDNALESSKSEIDLKITSGSRINFSVSPAEDGYDLAETFLDEIGQGVDVVTDIDKIYGDFCIHRQCIELDDKSIRAVTVVLRGLQPMVAVNLNCPFNQGSEGFRFTLAHELCHILHDRQHGKSLAVVSGPWAAIELEKRANAFAAMLLMPRLSVQRKIESLRLNVDSVDAVGELASHFKTSARSTFEHLSNLGFINYIQRELMKDQFRVGAC